MQLATKALQRVSGLAKSNSTWTKTVDNVGSTARDHLANERTFLAWARTGLGFVGSGTGLYTAYHLHEDDDDDGQQCTTAANMIDAGCLLLITNGGMVLTLAGMRYYRIQQALQKGEFIMGRGGMATVCAATALSTAGALGIIARADTIRREERKRRRSHNSRSK